MECMEKVGFGHRDISPPKYRIKCFGEGCSKRMERYGVVDSILLQLALHRCQFPFEHLRDIIERLSPPDVVL